MFGSNCRRIKKKRIIPNIEYNARNVWGKIIYYLRQNSYPALHVICGSQSDVSIESGFLKVKIEDEYVFNLLTEIQNFNVIKRALNSQDSHLELLIEKKQKYVNEAEQDIKKLKKFIGNSLIIKGE